MPYKTILVHLANDPDHMERLDCAIGLADRFGAHLTAIYIATPIGMPAQVTGRGASLGYLAAATETARERAVEVEAECRKCCQALNLSLEWLVDQGEHTEVLGRHAHFADLTVVSQHPHDFAHRIGSHFPDDVALTSGGPVLMLPRKHSGQIAAARPLVAWKSAAQATRAVRDALPFLRAADQTILLTVGGKEGELPGTEISSMLHRHGVTVEIHNEDGDDRHAGEIVVAQSKALGCDLVVMGAYGHSRLRELVLGSTTNFVLNHAEMPLLVAH